MIYLNGQPLNVTVFPDKTSQVWHVQNLPHESDKRAVRVEWHFDHEGEFMHLAQLKALLDELEVPALLHIKYLPYGRQDKEVSNDTTFALYPFLRLLKSLKFNAISVMDPHNPEALYSAYTRNMYPREQIKTIIKELGSQVICYPDKGAKKKYGPEYTFLPTIHGEKVRDQATGKILSYTLKGECAGKNVLIVDDICDGGATFVLLAKDLLAAGAKSVVLFVTHGIFSKGLKPLRDAGIQRIYTQDGEASEVQGHIAYRRL